MRITEKDLEKSIARLNRITENPETSWTKNKDGTITANVGNYHLSGAYGGYGLEQMTSDSGGVRSIFGGYRPKRELYDLIHAYIGGISEGYRRA